ncbi:hypothetical protein [Flammeovirga pacifica]|uniref:G8 domain-containing protein n=1 Tax=Flammeovirga pacifica TaxID=915059 RepID=A0A1S1Z3V1_FLAPC|nr:hypothetical protein [Flammeovirga pacifica]OHX67755.1 hypothetical protein NH26_16095 [Flammeovirga pacifica]
MKQLLIFISIFFATTNLFATDYYPNGNKTFSSWEDWTNTDNWTKIDGGSGYPNNNDKVILGSSKSLTIEFNLSDYINGIYLELEADGRFIINPDGELLILGDFKMDQNNVQVEIYGSVVVENNLIIDNGNLFVKNGGGLTVNENFHRSDIGSGQINIEGNKSELIVLGDFFDDHHTPIVSDSPSIEINGDCYTKEVGFCDINLPVELYSFEVSKHNDKNVLKWSTAQEINNDYFILLKSIDKMNWIEFSKVKGAGNSNTLLKYSTVDNTPNYGPKVYYKMIQVDFDGSEKHYGPLTVLDGKSQNTFKVCTYSNSYTFLLGTEIKPISFTIISSNGKSKRFSRMSNNQFQLERDELFIGVNIIHVYYGAMTYSTKIYK